MTMALSSHTIPSYHPSLDSLHHILKKDLEHVNQLILEQTESSIELITHVAHHLIRAGGKRLRPLLTLASANLVGYAGCHHHALAACIEFIHGATLLHDDVIDQSATRRGHPTANSLWGNTASILVGDFLFSRAFELMVQTGNLHILKILACTSNQMSQGEILQLQHLRDLHMDVEIYFNIIEAKTGALFKAACEVGCLLGTTSEASRSALANFGLYLGCAFQLVDDILDYTANACDLGKGLGDDFHEGKVTLPVILTYSQSSSDEQAFWQGVFKNDHPTSKDFNRACELLYKYDAIEESKKTACTYINTAKKHLSIFPASPLKNALIETADFCVNRLY